MNPDWLGWAASTILMATLITQVAKQALDEQGQGVSIWLFAGQIAASAGFIVYSVLVDNKVFIVTNGLILLTALIGQYVTLRNRRRREHRDRSG